MIDVAAAEEFVWRHARTLDRRRFVHHFHKPDPDGVTGALSAYRNASGGFGHALEPDCRAPVSQPVATSIALRVLHEVGRLDHPFVASTVPWLARVATPAGGVPFCLPDVRGYPRAPWWEPEGDPPPPNVNPTGEIVGLLRAAGTDDPFVDRAEAYCRGVLESGTGLNQYSAACAIEFAIHAPGGQGLLKDINARLAAGEIIPLDPGATGADLHTPLDFAPAPAHPCRIAFADDVIHAFLDKLEDGQQEDGGWSINWPAPGETAILEWRAFKTIEAMRTLRAYDRLPDLRPAR